jgi:enamine deaminase RidA (YjgF/YER057c/UK114 family)
MPFHISVPALAPTPGYAHVSGLEPEDDLVVTAGAVPLDDQGTLVGSGDVVAQTRQVVDNLRVALEEVGSGLERVLKTTVFVVSSRSEDLARVWDVVRASRLSVGPHASTLLGVSALGYPGQLVEIEALAVRAAANAAAPGPLPGRRNVPVWVSWWRRKRSPSAGRHPAPGSSLSSWRGIGRS